MYESQDGIGEPTQLDLTQSADSGELCHYNVPKLISVSLSRVLWLVHGNCAAVCTVLYR